MKFSTKQSQFLSNVLVSVSMTGVMTCGMLLVNSGFCKHFFKLWLNDFFVGCYIAIPTGLLIVPIISKWLNNHTENKNIR